MSLARLLLCMLIGLGVAPGFVLAWEEGGVAAELRHASDELSHAADTDPSHPSTATDPLSVDPDLAIWTLVVFVVLLVILKKFAWGPILSGLDRREKGIADHIAQAERNHAEARALLAQYEQKLAAASSEVRELMEEARREAEQVKHGILAEAKSSAEAERVRALRDIETAADQAIESLAERSAQLAVELAGKIVKSKLSSEDHARLIKEAVSKFATSAASDN